MTTAATAQPDFTGIPAHGNQRTAWDAGTHPDHANPEYR